MKADVELLIQPYCLPDGRSLLETLIQEFTGGNWAVFRSAVAFARTTGNYTALVLAMLNFAKQGGRIEMTFGADTFSQGNSGSDYQAIKALLSALGEEPTVRLFLYHEKRRTFHPKVYLFANEEENRALLVVGSSNWSTGGFWENVEVNVILRLDLGKKDHSASYHQIQACFDDYWMEQANEG